MPCKGGTANPEAVRVVVTMAIMTAIQSAAGSVKSSAVLAALAGVLFLASGCTCKDIYQSGLGWRQNECRKVLDGAERARCMETANKDYDSYNKEKTAPADQR
jgi:hypothetical protein